jgi:hypothetical protein
MARKFNYKKGRFKFLAFVFCPVIHPPNQVGFNGCWLRPVASVKAAYIVGVD